ncbi:hypothetical protein ACN38_g5679 [Penicillium nordicum]|uniref:Uncharacterized protein n=1 Tax=Penicillium nordicum TaxID=229535 RepID=A0A0M8P1X1_9EURO|nr:hypothetical protein ACN38_g5679 [Penicillium nordicum]
MAFICCFQLLEPQVERKTTKQSMAWNSATVVLQIVSEAEVINATIDDLRHNDIRHNDLREVFSIVGNTLVLTMVSLGFTSS